jgi:hypothetical protein
MQLVVDREYTINVEPTTTFAAALSALAEVHPTVPSVLGERTSVVIARSRDSWAQLESAPTRTMREWLGADASADTLHVQLAVSERCSHGSPGVPGLGYACGWC